MNYSSCKENKGFLLIGLIIAVAIIAILFAIVLSGNKQNPGIVQYNLGGKDVAMQESMDSLIINSSVYYTSHSDYSGFCDNPATKNVYNSIVSENKYCNDNFDNWVVCARLSADNARAWCVDNTGKKEQIDNGGVSGCNSSLTACP